MYRLLDTRGCSGCVRHRSIPVLFCECQAHKKSIQSLHPFVEQLLMQTSSRESRTRIQVELSCARRLWPPRFINDLRLIQEEDGTTGRTSWIGLFDNVLL